MQSIPSTVLRLIILCHKNLTIATVRSIHQFSHYYYLPQKSNHHHRRPHPPSSSLLLFDTKRLSHYYLPSPLLLFATEIKLLSPSAASTVFPIIIICQKNQTTVIIDSHPLSSPLLLFATEIKLLTPSAASNVFPTIIICLPHYYYLLQKLNYCHRRPHPTSSRLLLFAFPIIIICHRN